MQYQTIANRTYYHFEEVPKPFPRRVERRTADRPLPTVQKYGKTFDEPRFWRRQFGGEVTRLQRAFDWTFGVWLPLICFYFDPIVFRDWDRDGHGLLGSFQVFAYSLGFVSIMAMAAWLLFGEKLKWLNGLLAGLFLAGAAISLVVGVVLFPFSLIGMLLVIGFLGYTPLVSGLIYMRNGVRAAGAARPFFEKRVLVHVAILTGIASIALPWVLNQTLK